MNEYIADIRRLQDEFGLMPLPCLAGEKHPYIKWTKRKGTPPSPEETSTWFATRDIGLWSPMGPEIGWVILDIDNDEGGVLWRERLGDLLDQTATVRTRKGLHHYFTIPTDAVFPPWTWEHEEEAKGRNARFEVLSKGYGVMLPPSLFPDGPADDGRTMYEWVRGPEHALPAPTALRKPSQGLKRPARGAVAQARSTLAGLLDSPAQEGGRNNWHTEVAGHLARMVPYEDGFLALAKLVNLGTPLPLDEGELLKTWSSVWNTEQTKGPQGNDTTGWLSSDGSRMFCVVRMTEGDAKVKRPTPWLNGDIRVTGVVLSADNSRSYQVVVHRTGGVPVIDLVKASTLGSPAETKRWLARHGMSVEPVPVSSTDMSNGMEPGARLIRYFESHQLEPKTTVSHLGWHDNIGFVCHEGVITAEGLRVDVPVMPEPDLKERAPYTYGMGDVETTKEILAEILDYQEPWVAAVFGSWWIMTFLKGQVMTHTAHFPYMIIEAASEAGKTRGMFSLLRTLSGTTQHGTGTKASIRDSIGANRSGVVHVDDPDSVDHLAELLREAPGEGTWTKKDNDNKTTVNLKLVAPIMISGESIDLRSEKAHRDRSVEITGVPSPKTRMSLKDPSRPQIDDVMAMMARDLTAYSGTMVMLALQQGHWVDRIKELRGAAGRHNEVMAIVRTGARVLDGILERSWAVPLVDAWADQQVDLGSENTLVTKVLPWVLLESHGANWTSSHPGYFGFLDDRTGMWLHAETIAALYQKEIRSRGKTDRLDSVDALIAQLKDMKAESKQKKINGKNRKAWWLPDNFRQAVWAHAGLVDTETFSEATGQATGGLPGQERIRALTERSRAMQDKQKAVAQE